MAYTKTNWVNGTTPINETNLNKIENELETLDNGVDILTANVLYSSSGSNNLTLTLNDDISNYSYVEIICSLDSSTGVQFTAKGLASNSILLTGARQGYLDSSYYGVRLNTSYVNISGTTLTKTQGYTLSFKSTGEFIFTDSRNDIYIHKVLGYK